MEPAIRKNITIGTSPDRVWRTLTNTALMAEWLSDNGIAINTTWEPQTTITFTGTWHHGGAFNDKGIVFKFEKEEVLQYSYYSSISKLPDIQESYLVITFKLTSSGNETVLELTTENIPDYATYGHWNFYWTVTLEIIKRIAENIP